MLSSSKGWSLEFLYSSHEGISAWTYLPQMLYLMCDSHDMFYYFSEVLQNFDTIFEWVLSKTISILLLYLFNMIIKMWK